MVLSHRPIRRGFTLVELIVAAVVAALVAGSAVGAVSQMLRLKTRSLARQQAWERADMAVNRIALDLCNIVRHHNLQFARVSVSDGGPGEGSYDSILLLTRSSRPVRNEMDLPEGGEYEVQYRVQAGAVPNDPPTLWRRCDPAFDAFQDAGGIAAPIARGVKTLSIRSYDGTDWFDSWDSDTSGYPHAVMVQVTVESDDRLASATSRRVIAIDRTPTPPEPVDDTGTNSNSSSGTSGTGGAGGSGGGS